MTAEFYLQTVEKVFQKHALPKGEFLYRDQKIDPAWITKTALLAIEEDDDISDWTNGRCFRASYPASRV